MTNNIKKILLQELNENDTLTNAQKEIAIELLDIFMPENTDDWDDSIYESEMFLFNSSHPNSIWGHIGFNNGASHKSYFSKNGVSIKLNSFELCADLTLKIHKTVNVGFNTNSAVNAFAGHDYIAPSVNCTEHSIESFKINSAMDILDVFDDIAHRTMQAQFDAINDLDGITFGNGHNMKKAREALALESVKYSFWGV